ncbi:hypothetical protein GCM10010156_62440 [Planobispora rosea]|uniref:HTH tetR-type domain-containing protein n=1 Tax=Planobispora rosea TaxID=35762 RepID=A0A8J3S2Z4_PLARO|nr:hypothetical protein GCM10010156_62440 [Planobispora rosea]GIH87491.1 hypothetical protein Pro02_58990 [Planobispora rosea]
MTIRSLAQELGVKPMSLYYYVANKEEILDALAAWIPGDRGTPSPAPPPGIGGPGAVRGSRAPAAERARDAEGARKGHRAASGGDPRRNRLS